MPPPTIRVWTWVGRFMAPDYRSRSRVRIRPVARHALGDDRCHDHALARRAQPPGRQQPGRAVGRAAEPGGRAHRRGADARRRAGRDRRAGHGADAALPAAVDPLRPVGRPQLAPPPDGRLRAAARRCRCWGCCWPVLAGQLSLPLLARAGLRRRRRHGRLQRRRAGTAARAGAGGGAGAGQQPAGTGAQRGLCRRPGAGRRAGGLGRRAGGFRAGGACCPAPRWRCCCACTSRRARRPRRAIRCWNCATARCWSGSTRCCGRSC